VEQTLRFAATMRAPQRPGGDLSREDFITDFIDILMTIFGLKHAKDTVVGDVAIHGVSGGEKKRVSICETLAMRSLIGAWDKYVSLHCV
jgi:ATP-binding cassette subfamily G (WHITE) protein 2 (SNQ2)